MTKGLVASFRSISYKVFLLTLYFIATILAVSVVVWLGWNFLIHTTYYLCYSTSVEIGAIIASIDLIRTASKVVFLRKARKSYWEKYWERFGVDYRTRPSSTTGERYSS